MPRKLTREAILEDLSRHAASIRAFGALRLSLFGSYARGDATGESDLDFLVEFAPGRGLFDDYAGLLNLLQDLFGTDDIDLVKTHLVREELREAILGGERYEARL